MAYAEKSLLRRLRQATLDDHIRGSYIKHTIKKRCYEVFPRHGTENARLVASLAFPKAIAGSPRRYRLVFIREEFCFYSSRDDVYRRTADAADDRSDESCGKVLPSTHGIPMFSLFSFRRITGQPRLRCSLKLSYSFWPHPSKLQSFIRACAEKVISGPLKR